MTPWIKMRTNLWSDPRVVALMDKLNLDRAGIIGRLYQLWAIADQHTTDGNLKGYSAERLDETLECKGLAKALESIGWLSISKTGTMVLRFHEHNGESAKKRAQGAKRQDSYRGRAQGRNDNTRNPPSVTEALPDRETEEEAESETEEEEEDGSDHTDLSFLREEATKLAAVVHPKNADDRLLILRACALATAGKISEHCLRDAVEAVKRAKCVKKRPGYFFSALAYSLFCAGRSPTKTQKEEARKQMTALLETVVLPPELRGFDFKPKIDRIQSPRSHTEEPKSIGSILSPGKLRAPANAF